MELNAYNLKTIADAENKHPQSVYEGKNRGMYIPVRVQISKKNEVVRYFKQDLSENIRAKLAWVLEQKEKIETTLEVYKTRENQRKYGLTDMKFRPWLENQKK